MNLMGANIIRLVSGVIIFDDLATANIFDLDKQKRRPTISTICLGTKGKEVKFMENRNQLVLYSIGRMN